MSTVSVDTSARVSLSGTSLQAQTVQANKATQGSFDDETGVRFNKRLPTQVHASRVTTCNCGLQLTIAATALCHDLWRASIASGWSFCPLSVMYSGPYPPIHLNWSLTIVNFEVPLSEYTSCTHPLRELLFA